MSNKEVVNDLYLLVAFVGVLLFLGSLAYNERVEKTAKLYAESTHYFERDCKRYNGSMK